MSTKNTKVRNTHGVGQRKYGVKKLEDTEFMRINKEEIKKGIIENTEQ
jgi:hypothetical protein